MGSMTAEIAAQLLDIELDTDTEPVFGGMSGAGIVRARRQDGMPCMLKFTSSSDPHRARLVRHERDVYRDVGGRLPLRMPELYAHLENNDLIALVMSVEGVSIPVTDWSPDMWCAVTRDLARLHEFHAPVDVGDGADYTRADPLLFHRAVIPAFWREPLAPYLPRLFRTGSAYEHAMRIERSAFIHGDCHAGNILWDGESPVWIDWQQAGVSRRSRDLALLGARSAPFGASIPDIALDAYRDELGGFAHHPRVAMERGMLGILLFEWPDYVSYLSDTEVANLVQRCIEIVEAWLEQTPHNPPVRAIGPDGEAIY